MSADFEKAIDHAVREMLDVEPPAGLRRRVIERLPASGSRLPAVPASRFRLPASGWTLGAATAAALVVVAVFLMRSMPRQPEMTTAVTQPPLTAPAPTPSVQPPSLEPAVAPGASRPGSDRRVVVAAVAASADVAFDAPPAPGFPRVPALSVPELSVSSIQSVAPVEGPSVIATDPIATPSPLAIEPLSAQGRQSQE